MGLRKRIREEYYKNFSENIKIFMKKNKLSNEVFAEYLRDVTPGDITSWRNGTGMPDGEKAERSLRYRTTLGKKDLLKRIIPFEEIPIMRIGRLDDVELEEKDKKETTTRFVHSKEAMINEEKGLYFQWLGIQQRNRANGIFVDLNETIEV